MSRRKNRARRSAVGFTKPAPISTLSDLNPFFSILAPPFPPKPRPVEANTHWFLAAIEAIESIPEKLSVAHAEAAGDFEFVIDGLYAEKLITGKCRTPQQTFDVFVRFLNESWQWGCNCQQSNRKQACVHVFWFLDYLIESLDQIGTQLARRVNKGQFDTTQPDMERFSFNPKRVILQMLESLIPSDKPSAPPPEDCYLPPLAEQSVARIAWNVSLKNSYLEVYPLLQQPKKRGDGWLKGRKISLESLGEHASLFSTVDRRIRELVTIDTTYYRATYHLDSVDAIECLVGAPNVLLDSEPAEVKLGAAEVEVCRNPDSICLRVRGETNGHSRYIFSSKNMVHIQHQMGLIELCPLAPGQEGVLKKILKVPSTVPLEYEQELLQAAGRLQNYVTVHFPEAVAGKRVEEAYTPVLLLRTRIDGALDYGLRLRDTSGNLLVAGRGPMLRRHTHEGESLQLVRSVDREHRLCQQLAERYGLEPGGLHGTVNDFEKGLQLIEQLQSDEEQGEVEILWDQSSQQPLRMLGSVTPHNVSVGISRKRDWFQLSGSCVLGDQTMELSELLSGLQNAGVDAIRGEFVRLGDKGWAKVSRQFRQQLHQLHDAVNQERGTLKFDATSAPAIRDLLAEQVTLKATAAWTQCLNRLEQAEKLEPQLPDNLQAELRDYQCDGFKWLRRLAEWGVGGVLADDMGLGKTLQTLAVILDRAPQGPSLVIAPTSVGFNWVREAQRFTPSLDVHLYRETERADFLQAVGPNSLVVCSYGLALRDAEALAGIEWTTLVLDEAQAIKNSRSKTSAAIATIPAAWKVALTGTPVENHLGELWSLFHVVSPGVLGGWEQFRRRFASPIEKDNDPERRLALRDRLRPFLLRRTKSEVLKDLPPRTETNLLVELTPAERGVYDAVRLSALGEIDELAKLSDVKDQRFRILALLTRMRQLACSPRLVHETWKERSSKLKQLCETLHELRNEGHRVLVFSQFVQHLGLIREMLDEESISYEYLDGSTDPKARQERVDSFQNGTATVFLISLKAGGTGLNLTAADYVIHMDPWWNPAVEDQATDRAHRIGQDKPVMVYRLISQGTIEEEILKLHDSKRDLVAGIMEGAQAAAKLSTEDLIALLRN
jgi:superfamily II DNA or RNA helicase